MPVTAGTMLAFTTFSTTTTRGLRSRTYSKLDDTESIDDACFASVFPRLAAECSLHSGVATQKSTYPSVVAGAFSASEWHEASASPRHPQASSSPRRASSSVSLANAYVKSPPV